MRLVTVFPTGKLNSSKDRRYISAKQLRQWLYSSIGRTKYFKYTQDDGTVLSNWLIERNGVSAIDQDGRSVFISGASKHKFWIDKMEWIE